MEKQKLKTMQEIREWAAKKGYVIINYDTSDQYRLRIPIFGKEYYNSLETSALIRMNFRKFCTRLMEKGF